MAKPGPLWTPQGDGLPGLSTTVRTNRNTTINATMSEMNGQSCGSLLVRPVEPPRKTGSLN